MELPRAQSSPQEQGRLEEAAVGDLPTMVVEAVVVEAGNHLTTTMAGVAEGAKSPSTPLTCLAERSPAAAGVAVASLSIPSACLEERNQEGEMEATGPGPPMESRDPAEGEEGAADPRMEGATVEEGATGQDPPMEPAVGASFLASAFLT